MDPLHRTRDLALFDQGFDAVESIEGPDAMEVDLLDRVVAGHPGGVIVKVFVDGPTLVFAECRRSAISPAVTAFAK